jgi:hypothetical protein
MSLVGSTQSQVRSGGQVTFWWVQLLSGAKLLILSLGIYWYLSCICVRVSVAWIAWNVNVNQDWLSQVIIETIAKKEIIVHFFSSVAHVLVPGAKSTEPIVKKFVFS